LQQLPAHIADEVNLYKISLLILRFCCRPIGLAHINEYRSALI